MVIAGQTGSSGSTTSPAPVQSARPGSTWAVPAFLDALGYDTFWEHWDEWHQMAAFDRDAMHRASPNPAVFEASDPYVFVFYALPRECADDMLARLRAAAGTVGAPPAR